MLGYALHTACNYGSPKVIKIIFSFGGNLECKTFNTEYTSLSICCIYGQTSCALNLILLGARINAQDAYGNTPLILACTGPENLKRIPIIQSLLKNRARVNHTNLEGQTALWMACKKGTIQMVEILVSNGAQVQQSEEILRVLLMRPLCEIERIEFLTLLAKHGLDLNKQARLNLNRRVINLTPLQVAIRDTQHDLVKLLLSLGVDTTISPCTHTLLERNFYRWFILSILIIIPSTRQNIVACTAQAKYVKETIWILESFNDVDVNGKDMGVTALHCACIMGDIEFVKNLFRFHPSLDINFTYNRISLLCCVSYN